MQKERSMPQSGDRESASGTAFAREAGRSSSGFLREVWDHLRHSKKWWLAPVILFLLIVGALVLLSGTSAAPLIYTLF
jgi:hypothetical protein